MLLQFFKISIFVLFLVTPNLLYATDWYFGVGRGWSSTNYNVDNELDNYLHENPNEKRILQGLDFLGYPINISSDVNDRSYTFFIGKHLTQDWAIETLYLDIGRYQVSSHFNFSKEFNLNSHKDASNVNLAGRMFASAEALSYIDIQLMSLSVLKYWNTSDTFLIFNRLGVSHVSGTIVSTTTLAYDYNVVGDINSSGFERADDHKKSMVTGVIPHYGIGIRYNLDKNYAVRLEFVRYGYLVRNSRIDNISVDFMYMF